MTPQNVQISGGWLSSGIHGTVKFSLDMAIGETSKIESTDKGKIDDIVQRVRDLNSRLQDIRREQVFQRVCFAAIDIQSIIGTLLIHIGTRGRIPRPVRTHKRSRRPLDSHSARCPCRHLRVAAFALAGFLHQAEAYLDMVERVVLSGTILSKIYRLGQFGCIGGLYCRILAL